jgi:hypothetical protein
MSALVHKLDRLTTIINEMVPLLRDVQQLASLEERDRLEGVIELYCQSDEVLFGAKLDALSFVNEHYAAVERVARMGAATERTCAHFGGIPARCLWATRGWAPGSKAERCSGCPDAYRGKSEGDA